MSLAMTRDTIDLRGIVKLKKSKNPRKTRIGLTPATHPPIHFFFNNWKHENNTKKKKKKKKKIKKKKNYYFYFFFLFF